MKNVALAVSYRFEEANILLDVLKNNFIEPIKTHVFVNLNEAGWAEWGDKLDLTLVDELHLVHDSECHPSNTSRDSKRRQPLQMFCQAVAYFATNRENFVYMEGDCFPLNEQKFLAPFEKLNEKEAVINHFDFANVTPKKHENSVHRKMLELAKSQAHKMPDGYVYPGTMYITWQAAKKLFKYIIDNTASLVDGKKNYEGCLGVAFTRTGIFYEPLSKTFCYIDDTLPNQIDPVTLIVHQNNPLNLKDEFLKNGITKGDWVKKVTQEDTFSCAAMNTVFSRTEIASEIGTLVLDVKRV